MSTSQDDQTRMAGAGPEHGASPKLQLPVVVLKVGNKTYRLQKERVVIGSVVSADIRLSGAGVSPIHTVIEVAPALPGGQASRAPLIVAYDLASESGTLLNGKRIVTQALRAGDEIAIGSHRLHFSTEDASSPQQPRDRVRTSGGRKLYLSPDEDLAPLLLEDEREVIELFDFRPTAEQALEVVMSWAGTILDVQDFVHERQVTVGNHPRSDFAIPPLLSAARYPIVTRTGGTYTLNIDTRMRGVVQRKGQVQTLEEIRSGASPGQGGLQIPFERNDFAKITVGEVDFYLCFTPAPPRLKRRRIFERDPFFLKIAGSSMLLTLLTIVALVNSKVPQNLEAEQIPERIATILYQPERFPARPRPKTQPTEDTQARQAKPPKPKPQPPTKLELKPKPVPTQKPVLREMSTGKVEQKPKPRQQQGQNQAREGEGKRAKGPEGQRGKPKATQQGPAQTRASRPSPSGKPGGASGNSQVPEPGNIDLLKSAGGKIQDLLGNSAEKLGKDGDRLKGFGGFSTPGRDGQAFSGDGKGGGGTADTLVGGLSDKGTGGGRVGTGQGAAGSGNGIIGGKSRVVIRTGGPEETVVMGAIDAEAVLAAILAHRDEFRLCYEREINAERPNLAGSVGTSFVIGSSGRVTQAGIESTTLKNVNVERCVLGVIRRIDFPIPRGGGTVQVTFPFKFSSAR